MNVSGSHLCLIKVPSWQFAWALWTMSSSNARTALPHPIIPSSKLFLSFGLWLFLTKPSILMPLCKGKWQGRCHQFKGRDRGLQRTIVIAKSHSQVVKYWRIGLEFQGEYQPKVALICIDGFLWTCLTKVFYVQHFLWIEHKRPMFESKLYL